jgi:large subunit ribosomal protein L5
MPKISRQQVNEKLKKELGIKNTLALPRLEKVVINVGLNKSQVTPGFLEQAEKSLAALTGQKPARRRARQAIAGFKIRRGEIVGLQVTLRGRRLEDFVIKLANIVLPRMRDFRGLKLSSFDKDGNYTLGIAEQVVFPEITSEQAENLFGLAVTITTSAKNIQEGKALLEAWGFPFERSDRG